MLKYQKRKEFDIEKYTAHVAIGGNYVLKSNVIQLEELQDGLILYATLEKQIGSTSMSVERYKVIVEPPTFWERFLGIDLEAKVQKAIRRIKQQSKEIINADLEPDNFSLNRLIPNTFHAFVV